ncbi:MAG: penicillin-binding protein activator LpoB [Endomicrobium sp.]|jgi:uncharacterized protein (TIGR02722 family)|nr:penicillin-binding protein activator LpoB [Endomicrobium sp.]
MKVKRIAVYLLAIIFAGGLFACSAAKVTRVAADEIIDFSGNWNDTDSHQVSAEMIRDAIDRPWVDEYLRKFNKKPRVIVGIVVNKSDEHITTETFIKDLEIALTNSGKVVMVASKDQRGELREERDEQSRNARVGTVKAHGQETGADFMIKGQINTIPDQKKGAELKYYQVELEMINIETNEKVWIGQKQIKKVIAKKSYK